MATQTPEYLSPTVVAQTQALLDQGDVSGAWQILADHGDTYADNAAAVTGGATTPEDLAYQYMVESSSSFWRRCCDTSRRTSVKDRLVFYPDTPPPNRRGHMKYIVLFKLMPKANWRRKRKVNARKK